MVFNILSTALAVVAIIVSIVSARYAYKLSQLANQTATKSLRASHLQKYSDHLSELSARYRSYFAEVPTNAHEALLGIINLFDRFSKQPSDGQAPRHIAYNLIESFGDAFKSTIGTHNGSQLYSDIKELAYFRSNLAAAKVSASQQAQRVWKKKRTRDLYEDLTAILVDKEQLLLETQSICKGVLENVFSKEDEFERELEKLDQLIEENGHEEVKISESPDLDRHFRAWQHLLNLHLEFRRLKYLIENPTAGVELDEVIMIATSLDVLSALDKSIVR